MDVGLIMDFTSSDFHLSRKSTFSCSIHSKNGRMSLSCTLQRRETPLRTRSARVSPNLEILAAHEKKGRFRIEEIGD